MRRFSVRQIAEQFADGGVRAARGRLEIEATRVRLHLLSLLAHRLYPARGDLTRRVGTGRSADFATRDVGQVTPEPLRVEIDQRSPMLVLLRRHVVEQASRIRIVLPQVLSEVRVDAPVLLLAGHRQREEFLLGQIVELAQRLVSVNTATR